MQITHGLTKERLSGMVIARKKEIVCETKFIEISPKTQANDQDLEMC